MTKSKEGSKKASRTTRTATRPTSARLLPNRPLDPKTDDADVRPPSAREKTFGAAAAELGPESIEQPGQVTHPELLASAEEATRPVAVQNGRMLATYVGLGLERGKENEKLVHLDFSFPLEESHNGHVPTKVKDAWDYLITSENKLIQISEVAAVTLSVFSDPKKERPLLHLTAASFSKAIVSIVEEVGKGKAKKVTRFSFRLLVERTDKVIEFGAWNDGEEFWLTMPATQKHLGE
jgi:hypothetical protein